MVQSIISWYNQANEDDKKAANWYFEAHQLAKRHPMGVEAGSAILAAYSINEGWKRNVEHFENECSGITPRCIEMAKVKAAQILEAVALCEINRLPEILYGKKIRCFYSNILNPSANDVVTIDRHAFAIAGGVGSITEKKYKETAEAYIKAAEILGILPSQLQAITWVCYRRVNGKSFYG